MATVVGKYAPAYATAMEADIAEEDLIGAADFFSRGDRVPRAVRQEFFSNLFKKPDHQVPDVYALVIQLPAAVFATTNFDSNLADATPTSSLDNDDPSLKSFIDNVGSSQQVIHLHGRHFKYDTLVFDKDSFRKFSANPRFQEVLKVIFTQTCVVGLGYSASDPDILWASEFVANELGGAGASQHFLLVDRTPPLPRLELLRRANWTLVRYAEGQHGEVTRFVRGLVSALRKRPQTEPSMYLDRVASASLRTLAVAFSTVGKKDAGAYEGAGRAVVARVLASSGRQRDEGIIRQAASLLAIQEGDARPLVRVGIQSLEKDGSVVRTPDGITIELSASAAAAKVLPSSAIEDAVILRARTYAREFPDREDVRSAIRRIVGEVMFVEGLTVARSFVGRDDAEAYDLDRLIAEGFSHTSVSEALREPMRRSIAEIIRRPDEATSRELHRLANAAYVMERIMLHPQEANLGEALQWKMYFDSNVVMRFLSKYDEKYAPFSRLIRRFRQLHVPLLILEPFVDEMVANIRTTGELVRNVRTRGGLLQILKGLDPSERSPFLAWFYGDVHSTGARADYKAFLDRNGLDSKAALVRLLGKKGFTVEGHDASRQMDTSQRETLWDHLRSTRKGDEDSPTGRRLRRNEATQIEWLAAQRAKGVRAWFLSIDSELRRALASTKDLIGARDYSGFVMSPAAWALRLNELHWAEVGTEGFVEMMWSLPERSPNEKLSDLVLVMVVEQLAAKASEVEPELMRDAVEAAVVRNVDSGGLTAIAESDKAEEQLVELAGKIAPKAVSDLLDDLVRRTGGRRGKR
ncbi:MAG TPA: SIR2 family protein [Polyangia bacterium]